jgi:hypothetical protein
MASRNEQGQRAGFMKRSLAWLAPFRRPLVLAALGGFAAGVLVAVALRGVSGGGWSLTGGHRFTADEVQAARSQVRYASQMLASFLGEGERAYGWRRYLRFDELQGELGIGDYPAPPARSDSDVLPDIVARLSDNHAGLELKPFADLRSALSAYVKMLDMSDPLPERAAPEPRMATTPQRRYR